jgi:hypothetical protein
VSFGQTLTDWFMSADQQLDFESCLKSRGVVDYSHLTTN